MRGIISNHKCPFLPLPWNVSQAEEHRDYEKFFLVTIGEFNNWSMGKTHPGYVTNFFLDSSLSKCEKWWCNYGLYNASFCRFPLTSYLEFPFLRREMLCFKSSFPLLFSPCLGMIDSLLQVIALSTCEKESYIKMKTLVAKGMVHVCRAVIASEWVILSRTCCMTY